jgi:N-acetylmuramoyl-L-alanine amidase
MLVVVAGAWTQGALGQQDSEGAAMPSTTARPEQWTVYRDSVQTGHAPLQTIGDVTFVDALSLGDALGLHYHRDEAGRYIFSLPANPVVFVPGGTFAQVGLDMIHFPLAPYLDEFRFYVPESEFMNVLGIFLPGSVREDSIRRIIYYTPPDHPLLSVDGAERGQEWIWRLVLDRPYTGEIALEDTSLISLMIDGVTPDESLLTVGGDEMLGSSIYGDPTGGTYKLETPRAIRSARLEGPDPGNVLTLVVTMADLNGEPAPALAYGERTVDEALAEDRAKWKIDKIVIDAGHGGQDPGAIGRRHRTREKDMALDMALLLRDEVKKRTHIDVVMTRDNDVFIPLGQRTKIANNAGGKLFISIHCNSSTSTRPNGHWTYFLSPARTERAMSVALKENSVIRYEERREDYPDLSEENFILLAMAQAQFVKESEDFATLIQSNMSSRTGLRDRGVDQAGFYVLIGASMPAVLVETAFLSNPREEKLLRDKNFRKKVAAGICDAIIEFKKRHEE